MRRMGTGVLCFALLCLVTQPVAAQRSLYWSSLVVRANLDENGRLHVSERLGYVFTGDWNGGERAFHVRGGQDLELVAIARIDRDSGAKVPLQRGNLDLVDHYDWYDGHTLRWRSRLPSDPEFDGDEIVYVLDYVVDGVLLGTDGGYVLDHDFAIPSRQGVIRRFSLDLTLDPAWHSVDDLAGHWEAGNLVPGESFVVPATLAYSGSGSPRTWRTVAPRGLRLSLAAALLATFLIGSVVLWRRERRLGRFEPLLPATAINQEWLAEEVLCHRPEVVGAAWDNSTGAVEVAALVARLVQEGKLASRVERRGRGWFASDVLHLELLVDRNLLEDYERKLIDGLFFAGDTTDTASIREHYSGKGFDPAGRIKGGLDRRVKALAADPRTLKQPVLKTVVVLVLVVGVALLVAAVFRSGADAPLAIGGLIACVVLSAPAGGFATASRSSVVHPKSSAIPFHVPLLMILGGVLWLLLLAPQFVGALGLAGLTCVAAAFTVMILHTARSTETAERVALRKRLAAARRWLREELRRPQPRLRDEWFPYLLAFGLGRHVDWWFRAFGSASESRAGSFTGGGATGVGGSSWTGGGGAFGGGGATAVWASAAGAMAAGVARPGSSGGSSGGGGGSSGGGGAGGW